MLPSFSSLTRPAARAARAAACPPPPRSRRSHRRRRAPRRRAPSSARRARRPCPRARARSSTRPTMPSSSPTPAIWRPRAACARPRRPPPPRTPRAAPTAGTSTDQNETRRSRQLGQVEEHRAAEPGSSATPSSEQAARSDVTKTSATSSAMPAEHAAAARPRRTAGSAARSQPSIRQTAPSTPGQDQPRLRELDVEPEQARHQQQHGDVRVREHVRRSACSERHLDARAPRRPPARASARRPRPSTLRPSSFAQQLRAVRARPGRSRCSSSASSAVIATDSRTALLAHSTLRLRSLRDRLDERGVQVLGLLARDVLLRLLLLVAARRRRRARRCRPDARRR